MFAALDEYRAAIDAIGGVEALPAVLTSATRDAANGADFTRRVREDYGLDARTIVGDEEARLSYLGATSGRSERGAARRARHRRWLDRVHRRRGADVRFHVSTQAGVVRHSERHIHHDPPLREELEALARDVGATFRESVPEEWREAARAWSP